MEIEEKGVKLRLTIVDTPGMKSYLLTVAYHRFGHVKCRMLNIEYLLLFSTGKCSGKNSIFNFRHGQINDMLRSLKTHLGPAGHK